jgi:hypothetical protein
MHCDLFNNNYIAINKKRRTKIQYLNVSRVMITPVHEKADDVHPSISADHFAFYKKVPVKRDIFRNSETNFSSIYSADSDDTLISYPERSIIFDADPDAEEDDEIPLWIRNSPKACLTRSHHINSINAFSSKPGTLRLVRVEPVELLPPPQQLKSMSPRPSSNPIGSSHLKAMSVSQLQRARRNNNSYCPYTATPPKSSARIREKLNRCNINEAAILFSLSSIGKKEKQRASTQS